jgi:hypothetical protein
MPYSLLADAEQIVGRFQAAPYIERYKDVLRCSLINSYQLIKDEDDAPRLFLVDGSGAMFVASAIINDGTTPESYHAAMGELRGRCNGDDDRAKRLASLYVLLYTLNRSVIECWNDKDDWRAMEQAARAALFDPASIEDDVIHICRDVLKIDAFMRRGVDFIKEKFLKAHEVLPEREPAAGAVHPRSCHIVAHCASTIVLKNDNEDSPDGVNAALAEIQRRVDGPGDRTTIATFFASFYILAWLLREEPGLADVWRALDTLMREEFLRYV